MWIPIKRKRQSGIFHCFCAEIWIRWKARAPIPFEQELLHAENYLSLERQRFQNRLKVVYEITARDFSIPSLTLQPIVENAVRHGVLRREEGGTVTIRTEETPDAYLGHRR